MNENINNLKKLVDHEVDEAGDSKTLITYLGGVKEFLNYSDVTHLEMEGDDDEVHEIQFGLLGGRAQDKRDCKYL